MIDYAAARRNMVANQIRANRVTDPAILDAFETIPRERFGPERMRGIAYADEDLHLGNGRYLIEPMVFARLLQTALPHPSDAALDIACGPGYTTAILARLVSSVVAVEQDHDLAAGGNTHLAALEIDNAAVVAGDPLEGCRSQQPFSLIVIAGGVCFIPDTLLDQLAEGGRLVTILHEGGDRVGRAVICEKNGGTVARRAVFDAGTPVLPGFTRAHGFVF